MERQTKLDNAIHVPSLQYSPTAVYKIMQCDSS